MFEDYKVIAVTPAGRKKYLEILLPYILRERGLIDEYHLWVNTCNESDIEYIKHLESCFSNFIRLVWSALPPNGSATVYQFYPNCVDEKTIYIKIDDDICFIELEAFNKLLNFRVQHKEYFLIYANIVNNVICSHIHQRLGIIPIEAGICSYDPFSKIGWRSGEMAANIHAEFTKNLENNSIAKYKYSQWILHEFERTSINFMCWFGEEFAKFDGQVTYVDDEEWLSVIKPKELNKCNAICGEALVSHFAYYTQRNYLESYTKFLQKYKQISYETAKKYNLLKEAEHIGLLSEDVTKQSIDIHVEKCIEKIRSVPIEQLKNAEWLEKSLLLELGLNDENLKEFPEHLHSFCGYGLKSWQYPNQFSKYLVWLSQQEIRSYLEIGCRHGGTFIITVEYLERFGKLDVAVGIDPFYSDLMQKYAASKLNVSYFNITSYDFSANNLLNDIEFDLILIDGDHSEEGVNYDYNLVKKYAKFIAFHDIESIVCPGVVNLWRKLKIQYSHNIEFIDQYPSVAFSYLGIGVIDTRYYNPHPVGIPLVIDSGNRPFWSVMIPTYNCANYLVETLKSILAQDPSPEQMQIEVVDDCSTKDDPEAIVKEIGQGRVSFFRKAQNGGATANFNTCIERAKGEWIHILHGDDAVLPGFYSRLRESIEKEPNTNIGAAFTRCIHIDENSTWKQLSYLHREISGIIPDFWVNLAISNSIFTPSIVVKRSVYEKLGGFHTQLGHTTDWEMWKRISVHYPIWYEPQPLALYRDHSKSDTSRLMQTGENISETLKAINITEYYLPQGVAAQLSHQAKEHTARSAFGMAYRMINEKGDIYGAINQIREGLKCSTSSVVLNNLASLLAQSELLLKLVSNLLIYTTNECLLSNTLPQNDELELAKDQNEIDLDLRDINFVVFPDWQVKEDLLYEDLMYIIKYILSLTNSEKIALLIYNNQIIDDDVNLIIADIIFHIQEEGDFEIKEEPSICIVSDINKNQWGNISTKINAHIVLTYQNQEAINNLGLNEIRSLELKELEEVIRNDIKI